MPHSLQSIPKLIKLLVLGVILLAATMGYWIFYPQPLATTTPYRLTINQGESVRKIATQLAANGLITSPRLFSWLSRLLNQDKKIMAGRYLINKPMSLWDLLQRLSNGKPDQIALSLGDGWTFKQIRTYLDSESQLTHVTRLLSESQLKAALKITAPRLEGMFYPDTYFVVPGQSDLELLHTAHTSMEQHLAQVWQQRSPHSIYQDSYQLLIMASLIQKETGNKQDMYQVAAVFNNRLRNHMRLQDDPAVFYGLNNRPLITRADFAVDTMYNTYLHPGLPPTPICTPSQAALQAAAQPTNDPKLFYFIAIGNGKSKFTTTYQQHKAAISHYLKK